jgi:hypothetical protein
MGPPTLDPTYDMSNKRESSGENICFCRNGSISESYSVTGLFPQASQLPYRPGDKRHRGIRDRHYIYPNYQDYIGGVLPQIN